MTFTILLAGKYIEINSLYETTSFFCKDYLSDGIADFQVIISYDDIIYEREKSKKEAELEGIKVVEYSDEYLETLAVYRKIVTSLLEYDIVLFHGSVVAVDGEGYLFTAKSGTGKSTHTRLWREYFGERAIMVNDDKPLLQITENQVLVYGTPWDGKHHLSNNMVVPLKAICILERNAENHIEKVTKQNAYPLLIQQIYRPKELGKPQLMMKTLQLVDELARKTSLYRLGCNMDIDAARVAYEEMKKGE